MSKELTIDQYLIPHCASIIEEFNEQFRHVDTKDELELIACNEFNEIDLLFRVGYAFKNLVYFENKDKRGNLPKTDIYVKKKNLKLKSSILEIIMQEAKLKPKQIPIVLHGTNCLMIFIGS